MDPDVIEGRADLRATEAGLRVIEGRAGLRATEAGLRVIEGRAGLRATEAGLRVIEAGLRVIEGRAGLRVIEAGLRVIEGRAMTDAFLVMSGARSVRGRDRPSAILGEARGSPARRRGPRSASSRSRQAPRVSA